MTANRQIIFSSVRPDVFWRKKFFLWVVGYAGDPAAFDMAEAKKYVEELTTNMADAIAKELKKK
jgi:hypothetical protein